MEEARGGDDGEVGRNLRALGETTSITQIRHAWGLASFLAKCRLAVLVQEGLLL